LLKSNFFGKTTPHLYPIRLVNGHRTFLERAPLPKELFRKDHPASLSDSPRQRPSNFFGKTTPIDQGTFLERPPHPNAIAGRGVVQRVSGGAARGVWLRARGAGAHIGDAVAGQLGGGCGHNVKGGWVGLWACAYVILCYK
jgi:hypothetical protein